jgi:hypothetical protein
MELEDLKDGMEFTATICGTETSGRISIDSDGCIYLCQNDCDGAYVENRHGYKYSWKIYDPISLIYLDLRIVHDENFSIKKYRKSRLDNII